MPPADRGGPFLVRRCSSLRAATLAWQLKPSAPLQVTRVPHVLDDEQPFADLARPLVAITPDGASIVYAGRTRLYRKQLNDWEAVANRPLRSCSNRLRCAASASTKAADASDWPGCVSASTAAVVPRAVYSRRAIREDLGRAVQGHERHQAPVRGEERARLLDRREAADIRGRSTRASGIREATSQIPGRINRSRPAEFVLVTRTRESYRAADDNDQEGLVRDRSHEGEP